MAETVITVLLGLLGCLALAALVLALFGAMTWLDYLAEKYLPPKLLEYGADVIRAIYTLAMILMVFVIVWEMGELIGRNL